MKITPHENLDPRNSLQAKARKLIPQNLVLVRYIPIYIMNSWLYHSRSRMSLLLHESEGKPRTNVNNKDILQLL